jgi:GH35 family endo-1,4-beta-xylanase
LKQLRISPNAYFSQFTAFNELKDYLVREKDGRKNQIITDKLVKFAAALDNLQYIKIEGG